MNKKCSKYEGLFIFSNETNLQKHIDECDDCKLEHEKMQKISELISEVKDFYKAKKQTKSHQLRVASIVVLLLLFGTTIGTITCDEDLTETLLYGETLSAEDLGLPVDSYGLLMVDNEF